MIQPCWPGQDLHVVTLICANTSTVCDVQSRKLLIFSWKIGITYLVTFNPQGPLFLVLLCTCTCAYVNKCHQLPHGHEACRACVDI